ncbi:MAG: proline--tRNA ligase [Deltaproteobacteria bacterium]|nr:proline--tRNA ligase [Deltaproteobacteria bacterium]
MRASQLHIVTYRNDPADAEVTSHKLMARAGYIHKISAGLYVYGPLLWRTLRKISEIVRQELDGIGGQEVQLPILQDQALWERSGRWPVYQASRTMLTTKDRKDVVYGLAPTAEEVVTEYVAATTKSYKQLPLSLYQIHTKFRDEIRPRFGLMRVKEFIMKDAYSFDADEAGLDARYEAFRQAYVRIFQRAGVEAFGVDADPGDIGGSGSMEFMVAAEAGEDAILIEEGGEYAANVEKATSRLVPSPSAGEDERPLRIEDTPGIKTVEQLHGFFPAVTPDRMVKTVLVKAIWAEKEVPWAVLIRGDQEVNEVKLKNHTGGLALRMLTDAEIVELTGAEPGFAGPIGLSAAFSIVADHSVREMKNLLCGVNQTDKHALDVNPGRDFPLPRFADLRTARAGEPGPRTGAPLVVKRGIEVGHIFKLGTKYSAAMGAVFTDEGGRPKPFVMGCYGIGVSRVAASAVEQHADGMGIRWPVAIAPFEVAVANLTPKDEDLAAAAEGFYAALKAAGLDALIDDRPLAAGAKMKDMELLGFPFTVVVGRGYKAEGTVELRDRFAQTTESVQIDALVATVVERVTAARRGLLPA